MKQTLAFFFGGRSVEHDVSIVTGLQAMEYADTSRYEIVPVYLARDGKWYTGACLRDVSIYACFNPSACGAQQVRLSSTPGEGLLVKQVTTVQEGGGLFGKKESKTVVEERAQKIDVAFLCMHGVHGEDGSLQGMLELSDIPYTSPSVGASAAGMDKALMKKVFAGCGFPMVPGLDFTRSAWQQDAQGWQKKLEETIGYPMYVKPARLGSSIGISCVKCAEELADALELAFAYDRKVVVEKGVQEPMEINCSVLGYGRDCKASVCEKPKGWKEFLTFDDKYINGGKGKGMQSASREIPAPIGEEMTQRIQQLACDIFAEMDCKGVVRIDFLVDQSDGALYVNEINTIQGSMAFYLWEPCGMSYTALIDELVRIALLAAEEKKANSYAYDSSILEKVQKGGGLKGAKGVKRG